MCARAGDSVGMLQLKLDARKSVCRACGHRWHGFRPGCNERVSRWRAAVRCLMGWTGNPWRCGCAYSEAGGGG